jgi:hypothetical protein
VRLRLPPVEGQRDKASLVCQSAQQNASLSNYCFSPADDADMEALDCDTTTLSLFTSAAVEKAWKRRSGVGNVVRDNCGKLLRIYRYAVVASLVATIENESLGANFRNIPFSSSPWIQ